MFRHISAAILLIIPLIGCTNLADRYDREQLYRKIEQRESPFLEKRDTETSSSMATALDVPGKAKDSTLVLSLEGAVSMTLEHNRELQAELFTPVIEGAFEQIEKGYFDPELFAELNYSEETATEISRSTEERFNVEGEETGAAVGIRQFLPTGTDVEAATEYDRSRSNRTPEQQEFRFGLTITQSLLRGFGPAVNLVAVRQAELGTKASLYELRGFIETLLAETETAYWRYVLAGEGIAIFENSLEIARQQLLEVENRIEVGVVPRNSAAAARTEVARREQALIEARSIQNERRLRLLRLLGIGLNSAQQVDLQTTTSPHTRVQPLDDLRERHALALRLRPELGEARLRYRQEQLEVVRTQNGLLPRLDLFIDLGKTGYAESFSKAWTNVDDDSYDLFTGIELNTSLGNRTARGRHRAAIAARKQAQAALANLEQLIHLDVMLAANEVERTRQQIGASKATRMLQEQTLKAEQERFSVGDVTSLLVAQAQRDLLVSELNEIEAVIDYRIALVNLYLAEGSLLERRGISLEGTP